MQARTVKRLALSLPEVEERLTWEEPTFRVRNKIFAMFADERRAVWVKSTHDEQRALCHMDPDTFFVPRTSARTDGWGSGTGRSNAASSRSCLSRRGG